MISANNVTLRIGKKALFEDVNIKFTEGNCYGLIGANGAGKSTFLKILSGQLDSTSGDVVITPGQRLSFLQQDHFKYDEYSVLDTVIMGNKRLYDIMKEKDAIYAKEDFSDEDGIRASELEGEFAEMDGWNAESDAAMLLNGLGIPTEDHYTTMRDLPGATKVKVLLAQALFGNPDILLLDEPTNHLDIMSKEILESAINSYTGTVLYVSHDRYFINKTASRILDLKNETILNYIGNYDYYLEKKEVQELAAFGTATQDRAGNSAEKGNVIVSDGTGEKNGTEQISGGGKQKLSWEEMKKQQAAKRKLENELKRTEDEIAKREAKIEALNDELSKPEVASNSYELNKIHEEQMQEEAALEELYGKWEELSLQKDC